ncbi:Rrf2 family transcriptional regulator [Amnibacterium sp. CER49]|uniref:RrF2 family transcriptional regulator n=1 Tax=Amnibacterium sp. CER49 TaxID=3039161 RepID=UPI002448B8E5|nr:Rrf2 family transcriptional regulator [Amnibacterium sp. CER49]MDH2444523.1 Rrf2 family transcriptional regulator [Amnibacterium sp. CER49]
MQVTAQIDYGVRAMIEIAAGEGRASGSEIAAAQGIPAKFLESILLRLRRGGLLVARRGVAGGYELARPADTISVADVIRVLDGPLAAVRGMPPEDAEYPESAARLRDLWVALRAAMREVLEATTLADIAGGALPPHVQQLLASDDAWVRR